MEKITVFEVVGGHGAECGPPEIRMHTRGYFFKKADASKESKKWIYGRVEKLEAITFKGRYFLPETDKGYLAYCLKLKNSSRVEEVIRSAAKPGIVVDKRLLVWNGEGEFPLTFTTGKVLILRGGKDVCPIKEEIVIK